MKYDLNQNTCKKGETIRMHLHAFIKKIQLIYTIQTYTIASFWPLLVHRSIFGWNVTRSINNDQLQTFSRGIPANIQASIVNDRYIDLSPN